MLVAIKYVNYSQLHSIALSVSSQVSIERKNSNLKTKKIVNSNKERLKMRFHKKIITSNIV